MAASDRCAHSDSHLCDHLVKNFFFVILHVIYIFCDMSLYCVHNRFRHHNLISVARMHSVLKHFPLDI